MRKIVAAINMTLDGVCDHTAGVADDKLLQHYTELLGNAGTMLYGRITFQLMKHWQNVAKTPTGNHAVDEFAAIMDRVPKIVFSQTLNDPEWDSAQIASGDLKEKVLALKQEAGNAVVVGSRSLIIQLLKLGLVDEFQLSVHPLLAGSGQLLFDNVRQQLALELVNTKVFPSGVITLYYKPVELH